MADGTTVVEIDNDQLVVDQDGQSVQVATTEANQSVYSTDQQVAVTIEDDPVVIDGENAEAIALTVEATETRVLIEAPIQLLNAEDQGILVTTDSSNVLVEEITGLHVIEYRELYVQSTQPATGVPTPYLWIQTGIGPSGNDWDVWFEDGN